MRCRWRDFDAFTNHVRATTLPPTLTDLLSRNGATSQQALREHPSPNKNTRNKNESRYSNDVVESFHAMDQEKTGEITAQQCYTLCLGMGIHVRRADLNALILQCNDDRKGNHITVDVVLKLLEMVSNESFYSRGGNIKAASCVSLTHAFITFSLEYHSWNETNKRNSTSAFSSFHPTTTTRLILMIW